MERPVAAAAAERSVAAGAAVALIDLVERLKARLDALVLPAWRVLEGEYAAAMDEPGRVPVGVRDPHEWVSSVVSSGVVDEVMAATGLGEGECRGRLALATADPVRVATLLSTLAAGDLALWQVVGLFQDTSALDPATADEVVGAVVAPVRSGDRPSYAVRRRRLRRELARRRADGEVLRAAVADRDARAVLDADGSGCLSVSGDGMRVVGAVERVDRIARSIRASGACPGRSLAQLRSDVALDLLLYGNPAASSPGAGEGEIEWSRLGGLPSARVQVVVPVGLLAGADGGVAEVPGHGWIGAEQARQIAFAPGSVWERLVTDPLTGALVEASTTGYVPPTRLRAQVQARDRVCRAPGCVVAASSCDLDHDVPWPAGPTTAGNLTAKHRRHHQVKTAGLWNAYHDSATDALVWTTLAGRRYVTHPHDYRELLDHPDHHDHSDHPDDQGHPRRRPHPDLGGPAGARGDVLDDSDDPLPVRRRDPRGRVRGRSRADGPGELPFRATAPAAAQTEVNGIPGRPADWLEPPPY